MGKDENNKDESNNSNENDKKKPQSYGTDISEFEKVERKPIDRLD